VSSRAAGADAAGRQQQRPSTLTLFMVFEAEKLNDQLL
jgi:hypothetical protein